MVLNEHGFNHGAEIYNMPIRQYAMMANGYLYTAIVPVGLPPKPVLTLMKGIGMVAPDFVKNIESKAIAGAEKKYLEAFEPALDQLGERWAEQWLPEVQRFLFTCESFNLKQAAIPELIAHLEWAITQNRRLSEIHFLVAFPMLLALNRFDELYHDLFPGAGKFDAFKLLEGLMNKSLEAGDALWKLSRRARANTDVQRVIETTPEAEVIGVLRMFEAGRAFVQEIDGFLYQYGKRGDTFDVFSEVSWVEDPAPVIKNLKDYISQPDRDIEGEQSKLAAQRQQAIAEARIKLKGYPQPVREQFERTLKAAQASNVLQEDHNYWIDQRSLWQLRNIALEFGRRLAAAGAIEQGSDVFYLTLEEMLDAARQQSQVDARALAARRKGDYERYRTIMPPPALGALPEAPPPNDTVGRTITKFFGLDAPDASEAGNVLHGLSGSSGKVRGIARVVRSLSEAGKLQKGDILVAETTVPPWTPLFATAAGIATDTGGILSHCAIVAREYRIPAVVGVRNATRRLEDGMLIEVDGDTGTVWIVE
jgi:pyruvate,water dikinase